jgi:hypothetical protein
MAMTAWSAKVLSNLISFSVNGAGGNRLRRAYGLAFPQHGHVQIE